MLPLLAMIIVVILGGLILLALKGEMDANLLVGAVATIILIAVGTGIVVAILAGTQTVMNSNAHLVMLMFKEALH
jgi:hypothetical protein